MRSPSGSIIRHQLRGSFYWGGTFGRQKNGYAKRFVRQGAPQGGLSLRESTDLTKSVLNEVLMTTVHSAAPDHAAQSLAPNEVVSMLIGSTVGEIERELVLQTLARFDGNRTHAARVLGLSVRTLRNKIRQYSAEGSDVPRAKA